MSLKETNIERVILILILYFLFFLRGFYLFILEYMHAGGAAGGKGDGGGKDSLLDSHTEWGAQTWADLRILRS